MPIRGLVPPGFRRAARSAASGSGSGPFIPSLYQPKACRVLPPRARPTESTAKAGHLLSPNFGSGKNIENIENIENESVR